MSSFQADKRPVVKHDIRNSTTAVIIAVIAIMEKNGILVRGLEFFSCGSLGVKRLKLHKAHFDTALPASPAVKSFLTLRGAV